MVSKGEQYGPRLALTNAGLPKAVSLSGSLSRLGTCINGYWQQKKVMAAGCEPAAVRLMMNALRPLAVGQSLAGAGGGGFLFLLTSEPMQKERVRQVLCNMQVTNWRGLGIGMQGNGGFLSVVELHCPILMLQGLGDFSVHSVEVDLRGISFQKGYEIGQPGALSEAEAGRSL